MGCSASLARRSTGLFRAAEPAAGGQAAQGAQQQDTDFTPLDDRHATVAGLLALWAVLTMVTGTIEASLFPSPVQFWQSAKQITMTGYADGTLLSQSLHSLKLDGGGGRQQRLFCLTSWRTS